MKIKKKSVIIGISMFVIAIALIISFSGRQTAYTIAQISNMSEDNLLHLNGKSIQIDGYISYIDNSDKAMPYTILNTKDMAEQHAYFMPNHVCVINNISPGQIQSIHVGQEMKVRGIAYVTQVDGPCTVIQLI